MNHILKIIVTVLGIFACSTAVIMIILCDEHPILIASYRLLLASVFLFPFFIKDIITGPKYTFRQFKITILPGLLLGIHIITWVIGAKMTPAANSSLIVNLTPLVMPALLYFYIKEVLTKNEIIGTIISLFGVIILSAADFSINTEFLWGDIICFGSMFFYAWYLTMARNHRNELSLIRYVTPLYLIGGVMCFIIALPFVNPSKVYSVNSLYLILGLAIIPTVIGHSLNNYSMKIFRGQIFSILNLSQFIFAAIMAYFFLNQIPTLWFYLSAIFIICGAILVFTGKNPQLKTAE